MDRDHHLAVLAMDAYHRGYNPGLKIIDGDNIGGATLAEVKGDVAAQAIGFFAQSYNLNGETIVAYRGTDSFFYEQDVFDFWNKSDIINGFWTSIGVAASPQPRQFRCASKLPLICQ